MNCEQRAGGYRAFRETALDDNAVALAWLGQAGFALRTSRLFALVDPYLSDHLANKYQGREFPHTRMMPAPVRPEDIEGVSFVCCTHKHSDHMDPLTLPAIAGRNPDCLFIVPAAEEAHAVSLGLPTERVCPVDAEESIKLPGGITLTAIASAHETVERDDNGRCRYLGYLLRLPNVTLYHSGDCVPYDGLAERLAAASIDVALLPVNGRDAYRRDRGVPGNMTFDEAVTLCREANIPHFMPHHFGMFDFNTVPEDELRARAAQCGDAPACHVPDADTHFVVTPQ